MDEFTIKKEKHIDYILNNFNFDKVQKTMKKLNWTWYDSDDVPTIKRMKESAKSLLEDCYIYNGDDIYSVSSGGFKATKMDDFFNLEFVAEHQESVFLNFGEDYYKIKKNKERKNKIKKIDK